MVSIPRGGNSTYLAVRSSQEGPVILGAVSNSARGDVLLSFTTNLMGYLMQSLGHKDILLMDNLMCCQWSIIFLGSAMSVGPEM